MSLAREILAGLEAILHAHAGFDLPEWVVETRALARMGALEMDGRGYLELLRSPRGAAELGALVEAVRVGETSFFRHRPHVDALLDVVVPAWRERGELRPRVWSAGCATGEEAYTLALVLGRALPRPSFSPTILATDVSAEALVTARAATYPAHAAESVPEPWRGGLASDGDVVRVRPEVTALVTFRQQNLADPDLPRGFDLVWCRNVLIYFGPEARMRVLEKIVASLAPGGFLFVGYSETLRDVAGLRAIRYADQVLWQKAATSSLPPGARAPSKPEATSTRDARAPRPAPPVSRAVYSTPPHRASTRPPASSASSSPPASLSPASLSPRAPIAPRAPARVATTLRITTAEPAALAAEIRTALGAPGLGALTIDLDAADYIGDEIAPVLRRAGAAAEAAGIELLLVATRPGPQRWLRRNGLSGGDS